MDSSMPSCMVGMIHQDTRSEILASPGWLPSRPHKTAFHCCKHSIYILSAYNITAQSRHCSHHPPIKPLRALQQDLDALPCSSPSRMNPDQYDPASHDHQPSSPCSRVPNRSWVHDELQPSLASRIFVKLRVDRINIF